MKPFQTLIASLTLITLPFFAYAAKSDQDLSDIKAAQEANSKTLAEATQSINSLRQEVQEMKGALEEARHFFQERSEKDDKVLRDFDYRLTGIEERLSLYGSELDDFLAKPKKRGQADEVESALYHRALSAINIQNFKEANTLFSQFLLKYPRSSLADNAQYWKGEALYASKDYPNAVLEFQKVIKKYPASNKVPAAMLKQGYCFYETKEYLDAKAFLENVITKFPKSDEAGQARERILKINQLQANKGPTTAPSATPPATQPTLPPNP